MYKFHYETPIGTICIEDEDNNIVGLYLDNSDPKDDIETELIKEAHIQLTEYFNKTRKIFDLPVKFNGTDFQNEVWKALQTIPYGETRSYGQIAEQVGNPKAFRAVGGANNKNRILIVVPCHRVIGADGSLVGFGCGIDIKKYLLDLEK